MQIKIMFVYIRSIFRTFFISTLVGESKTQQGLFIVYYINKINIYFRSEIVTKILLFVSRENIQHQLVYS